MTDYHLALCWNWEHDADFVAVLDKVARCRQVSFLPIHPGNLEAVLESLGRGEVTFRVLLDRASDSDERFLAVPAWVQEHGGRCLNRRELAVRAWDKAAMHRLLGAALHTPPTIILPPYAEQPVLPFLDLRPLGPCFSIKPAHGGGGEGVVVAASSFEQVMAARRERPHDRYLLQSHIVPAEWRGRPAWFRPIYCVGQEFLCWWDTRTHRYTPVTPEEEEAGLVALRPLVAAIARACGLDLFSSEIALTGDGRFVVVDYVNDPLDLRLQSRTPEGVPDEIVRAMAGMLVQVAASTGLGTS